MPQYDLSGNPLPEDNAPKTDLSGSPLPASPAPLPGALPPSAPHAVWPPPPTGQPVYGQPDVNTSGMKGDVPPEIAALKWNWGAFGLPFLWTVNHKMMWGWAIFALSILSNRSSLTLTVVTTILYYAIAVYLGLNGHKLGWKNRRFEGGVSQFLDVQHRWTLWGVPLFVLTVLLVLLSLFAGLLSPVLAPGGGTRP